MNARRAALVLLALLALVGAGLLIARARRDRAQVEEPRPMLPDSVTRIEVSYGEDEYSLVLSDGVWILEGADAFPLDQNACRAFADRLRLLSPVRFVSGARYESVGLDPPQCAITAEDGQGRRYAYAVGAESSNENLYYFGFGGAVYLIEPTDAFGFFVTPYDLMHDERPALIDAQSILSLSVRTSTERWHYTLTRGADGYAVRGTLADAADPDRGRPADPEQAQEIFRACGSLYLYDCVEYRALPDDALEAYGLRTPTARVELVYREKDAQADSTLVYLFGARKDGRIYLRIEGSDRIYTADETEAAHFLAPDFAKLTAQ